MFSSSVTWDLSQNPSQSPSANSLLPFAQSHRDHDTAPLVATTCDMVRPTLKTKNISEFNAFGALKILKYMAVLHTMFWFSALTIFFLGFQCYFASQKHGNYTSYSKIRMPLPIIIILLLLCISLMFQNYSCPIKKARSACPQHTKGYGTFYFSQDDDLRSPIGACSSSADSKT